MLGTNLEPCTLKSHGRALAGLHKNDWLILLLLVVIIALLNFIEPFHRYVGKDMMTDLMYPFKKDTIPFWGVPVISIIFPITIFTIFYTKRRDVYDFHHAILGILYSSLITGVITDSIKDAVGRPRPNFFARCFPDNKPIFDELGDVVCHGIASVVKEGYKSFPSGHTSWSFAGLGFLSWYLAGKVRVFDRKGHISKLCIVFLPLLIAALIGVTRVDDYWHHWTDVFAGALIGITLASVVYLHLFPFPALADGWAPHAYFEMMRDTGGSSGEGQRLHNNADSMAAPTEAMESGKKFSV
ncbi:hypothetical protein L6164_026621 [Bauhinia variegata]|uniref:Uncharacterized protein n=1 Tax=Bauhinia variegata TaxID=167791 RepID=A0ACB9LRN7_BAUVA|nr:hypothetical protein L6164_026621 [Bauhinia variegata]